MTAQIIGTSIGAFVAGAAGVWYVAARHIHRLHVQHQGALLGRLAERDARLREQRDTWHQVCRNALHVQRVTLDTIHADRVQELGEKAAGACTDYFRRGVEAGRLDERRHRVSVREFLASNTRN